MKHAMQMKTNEAKYETANNWTLCNLKNMKLTMRLQTKEANYTTSDKWSHYASAKNEAQISTTIKLNGYATANKRSTIWNREQMNNTMQHKTNDSQ